MRDQVTKHLKTEGVLAESDPMETVMKLKEVLGTQRFNRFLEIQTEVASGLRSPQSLYGLMETRDEFNLLFSLQADLMIEAFSWLTTTLHGLDIKPERIADLGCGTGILTRWLRGQFPEAAVLGFDRHEKMLKGAGEGLFENWDYAKQDHTLPTRCDTLVCSMGIDFPHTSEFMPLDFECYRSLAAYSDTLAFTAPIFSNWRSIAEEGARLLTVLRLPTFAEFVGVIDAAVEAGWSVLLHQSTRLSASDENLPAMVFKAEAGPTPDEDVLLSFWVGARSVFEGAPLVNDEARAFFRLLNPKTVVDTQYDDFAGGDTICYTLATCGPFALRFLDATTGFARLEIYPLYQLASLETKFSWQ